MYIRKLHLRAFGKFVHKRIYLGKKLNIIYGENETGKSTIHNFIEAVLYGFDNEYKGKSLFNRYKPWNSDLYKGSVSVDDYKGKKYNIVRDFSLGTVQIFHTELDENKNPVTKEDEVDCPGEKFLNMSKTSFRNTVSICQLGNKTDKELSKELKNKIINLSKTRDESISIDRILNSINGIKDEAGSEDDPKTLMGQYSLRLDELEKEKEKTQNINRQVMFLAMEKKKINNKIVELDMRIDELSKELADYELSLEKDIYLKAEPLKIELDEIKDKLGDYKKEDIIEFSKNEYDEAVNLEIELNSMNKEKQDLCNEIDEHEEKLKILEDDISHKIKDDFDIKEFNQNYSEYKNNLDKLNTLKSKVQHGQEDIKNIDLDKIKEFCENYDKITENNNKIEIYNILSDSKNYEKMKKFKKGQNVSGFLWALMGLIFIALAALSGYAAYYYQIPQYYGGTAAVILGVICFALMSKKRKRALGAAKELESIDCEYVNYRNAVEDLIKDIDELLKSSGYKNFKEMEETYHKKSGEKNVAEEKLKLLEFDKEKIADLENNLKDLKYKLLNSLKMFGLDLINDENTKRVNAIYNKKDEVKDEINKLRNSTEKSNQECAKLEKEIAFEVKRLDIILNSFNMDSVEQFKKCYKNFETYNQLMSRQEYLSQMLKTVLNEKDYDELRERTKNIMYHDVKIIDKKEHQLAVFKMSEENNDLLKNINDIDNEIDGLENSVRGLAEIEEEIDFYEDRKNTFKEKILIAEIAAEKIVEISDSIEGDFMPLLKKSISENFSYLTEGRYKEVIIDEDMNISVLSEENKGRNIYIESLSGGTIDQLYLSLRIGLSSILSGHENIPIILDDSFVQYDSNRLKKSMEMLAKESERRQVILFTCQEREVEYAKQMNLKFNYIKL